MRWKKVSNPHLRDERGRRGGGGLGLPMGMGRGGGMGMPRGKLGLVLMLVVLGISLFGGGSILGGGGGSNAVERPQGAPPAEEETMKDFASFVHFDSQQFWQQEIGREYQPAELVLFTDQTQTEGCGAASSAVGPFYCPADLTVRIDLSFFDELGARFDAPGDFAQAYVIAHEMGHHVQNVLGTSDRVRQEQQNRPNEANELSVRMELQADCLAGIWAASVYESLEEGDLEEAVTAAAAIGDDRLQKEATGRVNPESFTHGTSAQRVEWLQRGVEERSVRACDTFSASL